MELICGICGEGLSPGPTTSIFKVLAVGTKVDIRHCPDCGFVYCADCGVLPKGTKVIFGLKAAARLVCPRCHPDGVRADGRMPDFDDTGMFVGWRRL
jgi:hypothetical protein